MSTPLVLAIDCETASACDLKTHGAWAYSLHPSTRVWCVAIGWWREDLQRHVTVEWCPGRMVPPQFRSALKHGQVLAHNCAFEKAILANILAPKHGWPLPKPEQWQDTQAHAAAANLPITLEGLGEALGCPVKKDMAGNALMKKMAKLRAEDHDGQTVYVSDHDTTANWAALANYCAQDVVATLQCWDRVPKMRPQEERLWQLDQKINARGIHIDRLFVQRLQAMAQKRRWQLSSDAFFESDGDLIAATQTQRLKTWLTDRGIELPTVERTNVKGETTESESIGRTIAAELAADPDIAPEIRSMLENRLEASKATSLAKLNRVETMVDPRDGRLRNSLQFCAAHTGRWSSRGLQVHNLARPKKGDTPEEKAKLKRIYAAVLEGDFDKLVEACSAAT